MLRYRYSDEFLIPAPFVHVTLSNLSNQKSTDQMPAQVDSGADRTVVPATVVEQLELTPVRKLSVAGLGGDVQLLDTYLVAIRLRELNENVVEVLSAEHEPFVLLGRDVLNNLRIILDGPNRILEIDA